MVNDQIPKLQELMKNKEITVDNIDVFCEKGVFGLEETRRILEAGKAAGLALNFHGDELHPMKAAEVNIYRNTNEHEKSLAQQVNLHVLDRRMTLFPSPELENCINGS